MGGKNQVIYKAPIPEDRSGAQGFKPGKALFVGPHQGVNALEKRPIEDSLKPNKPIKAMY